MHFRFNLRRLCDGIFVLLLLSGCRSQAPDHPGNGASPAVETEQPVADKQRILFFGDSITAGYGIDPAQAYPALIQKRIDDKGWPFEVVNAGVSGETSAGGLRRIDWVLKKPVGVLVLELGANDGLRGLPVVGMKANLRGIIDSTRKKNPDVSVVIAGMRMPPNLGEKYSADFRNAFPELAKEEHAKLIPFILADVAGHPFLNQADQIHPTARGHRIVADNVWKVLQPILEHRLEEEPSS